MTRTFGPQALKQLQELGEAPAADQSGPEYRVSVMRASLPGVRCSAGAGVPVLLSCPARAWSQRRDTCSCTVAILRTHECHLQTWAWWLLVDGGVRIPCQALAHAHTQPLVVPHKVASHPCCSKGPAVEGQGGGPGFVLFHFLPRQGDGSEHSGPDR